MWRLCPIRNSIKRYTGVDVKPRVENLSGHFSFFKRNIKIKDKKDMIACAI
jgi:hypothetical protein